MTESLLRPPLSVVVAPTEQGLFLAPALEALSAQQNCPAFEVVVPIDQSIMGVEDLRRTFSWVRYIEVDSSLELASSANIGVAHLGIDLRRAAGLAEARGEVIALTEEHALPALDWCANLIQQHQASHAVIGGAIENANPGLLNWALYFMDAARYQNPLPEGASRFASDVNVSYKRGYLDSVSSIWRTMYNETRVHDAIRALGGTVWLTPRLVVRHDRGRITVWKALWERFAWARLYAGRRSQESSNASRFALMLGSPLLAIVLPVRAGRTTFARGRHRRAFLKALPMLLLMSSVWAIGEFTGYLTGRATRLPNDLEQGLL